MEEQRESVTQTQDGSATENPKTNIIENASGNDGYKRDMFRYKDEAKELKERIREFELKDEEKKGNLEGVITSLKDEIRGLKKSTAEHKFNFAETQLDSAIRQEALKQGCSNVDVFMRLVDDNDKGAVELDERFNVNSTDIKDLIEKSKGRYGDINLFGKAVRIADGIPSRTVTSAPKAKAIKDMSWDEAKAYMSTLKD